MSDTTTLERAPLAALKPYPSNARTHSKRQIEQIARSIERFGFVNPVLVSDDLEIVAGHGRVAAAKQLGLTEAPIVKLSHLSAAERRAYVIADNRLAELAGWDRDTLAIELQALTELEFEIEAIGFETAEIDLVLSQAADADPTPAPALENAVPPPPDRPVTQLGDVWEIGRHALICADARDPDAYHVLMDGAAAGVIFTDPPYNVPIDGFVGGKGKVKHRDFAMGVGEMSPEAFERFLHETLGLAAANARDGSIAFVCMDWRHLGETLAAGADVFDALKNICVWTKSNAGMGSLYRSQHELVLVFKRGTAAHVNNVALGKYGRNRSNVWAYAGVNAFGAARDAELAMHPTVKPVALIADAIQDVSRRGDIVLDPFAGSGSTLIAAEKCGRIARLIEIDPVYCDVIVRRFEDYTGKTAIHAATGMSFDDIANQRQRNDAPTLT
mgnify:CR=1 FL=1